jgi:hypothetical protein
MRQILPLLFVLLLGCQAKKVTDFQTILKCFKKVSLPYKIEAGHGSDALLDSAFYHQKILGSSIKWYQLHEQSELNIEALAPSHDNVNCGMLLFDNENFIVIDIQDTRIGFDRYLLVFSKNGELIDGIPVAHISKGKNGDEIFDIEQFSQLNSNLEIFMTENIKHSLALAATEEEKTTKTAVYQIQEDGKIKFLRK